MREEWAGLPLSLGRAWLRKKFLAEIVTRQNAEYSHSKKTNYRTLILLFSFIINVVSSSVRSSLQYLLGVNCERSHVNSIS